MESLHKKELKLLNTIRIHLRKDSEVIPPFINPLKTEHSMCKIIGADIIMAISPVFQMRILSAGTLMSIYTRINGHFDEMLEISTSITYQYYEWLNSLLMAYRNLCMVNELYECVKNIDELEKLLRE